MVRPPQVHGVGRNVNGNEKFVTNPNRFKHALPSVLGYCVCLTLNTEKNRTGYGAFVLLFFFLLVLFAVSPNGFTWVTVEANRQWDASARKDFPQS